MDKHYQAKENETKIYQLWEKADAFNPDSDINQKLKNDDLPSFSIIMPPPNANDPLHLGHAAFLTLEDILIRHARMTGHDTLWLPGADHAGIETQFVFEKKLKKEGTSRFHFDRATLYQMIWDYVATNSQIAIKQSKQLGASADWSRFKFTLDDDIVQSVIATFKQMLEDRLIYRANRLVNYCPKCGTGFSNLELDHREEIGSLYYLKYGPITIATTRPETIFADVAIAVHPKDQRYHKYHGQTIEYQGLFGLVKLLVIADDFVDPEFGTGAVKITPFHDFNDFAFWQRHQAELKQAVQNNQLGYVELKEKLINNNQLSAEEINSPALAIDFTGRLTKFTDQYAGLKAHIAREKIVSDLQEANLIEKIDNNYLHSVTSCYRCGSNIEPLPLPQFYVKVEPLTKAVLEKIKKKELTIYGAGHDKILKHWLENLEDWNISRQIVWGIRLPVWYDAQENPQLRISFIDKNQARISGPIGELLTKYSFAEIEAGLQSLTAPIDAQFVVSQEKPDPNKQYLQETDTFDTWFSSSQWPVVTLKNNQPGDFERFYPTTIMETAYDILMFWVMRMLMMGLYSTQQLPFKKVYLHGLIRDSKGQKMSKSKGNVINPLEIGEKYGTDALRMAIVIRSSAGLDKTLSEADFQAMRNLNNKLWNAARFILLQKENQAITDQNTAKLDKKFTKNLEKIVLAVSRNLDQLQLGLAADTLYNEFWHWFCDQCIEDAKKGLISQEKLFDGLVIFLKLFHPFIPFVTESIWQILYQEQLVAEPLLMTSRWPSC
ncbi:MAG TPA: valine--tRNA ligase [Candidatus Woesebacteria bacterium]|nr:valine--tRNA ligase [Candidatus Woesebacteria bacterium]HPK08558.1 valine--tRNA ligase [Candidatus Woesebacteria bacterium]